MVALRLAVASSLAAPRSALVCSEQTVFAVRSIRLGSLGNTGWRQTLTRVPLEPWTMPLPQVS
ncbi:MAG: hypothetical protein LBK95_09560, partial [Bifidobacteriaceae bacterium]|nr:hypothetical protein [Bifidobacteriaceae bacterium]